MLDDSKPKSHFLSTLFKLARDFLVTVLVWFSALSIFKFIYILLVINVPNSMGDTTIKAIFFSIVIACIIFYISGESTTSAGLKKKRIKQILVIVLGTVCLLLTGAVHSLLA